MIALKSKRDGLSRPKAWRKRVVEDIMDSTWLVLGIIKISRRAAPLHTPLQVRFQDQAIEAC